MGKLITYLFLMTGLTLLFYLGGLIQECDDQGLCEGVTPNANLLNLALKPENTRNSNFVVNAVLILEGIGTALLIFASKVTSLFDIKLAVKSGFALYLLNLGWDFLVVFNILRAGNPIIALLLFSPFFIGYIMVVIEWWGS